MSDVIYQKTDDRVTMCLNNMCIVPAYVERFVTVPDGDMVVYPNLRECLANCKPPVSRAVESYAVANLNNRDKPQEPLSPAFLPMIWGKSILEDQQIDPFLANKYQLLLISESSADILS